MNNRLIILLFIIAAIIAAVLLYSRQNNMNRSNVPLKSTGIIETIEVEISPEIQEKIEWLCCEEGVEVKKGDVLVRLNDRKLIAGVNEGKALLNGAIARHEEARANLENSKARVDSAKAVVQAAQSEIDRIMALNEDARENFNRIAHLFLAGYPAKRT